MVLTAIEIIALIFVLLSLVKIGVILINRKSWLSVVKKVYKNSNVSSILFLIAAILIFYYLLLELTLVQIFAVLAFFSLLIGIGFLQYSQELLQFVNKVYVKKPTLLQLIYIPLWLIFSIFVLKEIFS